jgi:hypothetical protein
LKREDDHELELEWEWVIRLMWDGGRGWYWLLEPGIEKIGVPQRAQEMLLPLLLSPGIVVEEEEYEDSSRRVLEDMGSIVS